MLGACLLAHVALIPPWGAKNDGFYRLEMSAGHELLRHRLRRGGEPFRPSDGRQSSWRVIVSERAGYRCEVSSKQRWADVKGLPALPAACQFLKKDPAVAETMCTLS